MVAAAAVVIMFGALAGCGDETESGAQDAGGSAATSSSSVSVEPIPPSADLREVCPRVEAALAAMPDATFEAADFQAFGAELEEIAVGADQEASNALQLLLDASLGFSDNGPVESIESHQAFLTALDTFAQRCRTAGSSALQ
jgi:hypothetical protein